MSRKTALVVDDETIARMTLVHMLEDLNFFVFEARDGVEAVQKAHRFSPSLIMMDISMPIMDGCSAAEEIRTIANSSPVAIVACTASKPVAEWSALFDAVLSKPFARSDVQHTVDALIGGGASL